MPSEIIPNVAHLTLLRKQSEHCVIHGTEYVCFGTSNVSEYLSFIEIKGDRFIEFFKQLRIFLHCLYTDNATK
jgi:hypothetical protein